MHLDNYAGHMRNFTGCVNLLGFLGGKVKPFYHATTMTRGAGGEGVSTLSFNQNYTPNCNIQEMRGSNIFKITPHCVTYRALKIP